MKQQLHEISENLREIDLTGTEKEEKRQREIKALTDDKRLSEETLSTIKKQIKDIQEMIKQIEKKVKQ